MRVVVHGTEGVMREFAPLAYIAATSRNDGRRISKSAVLGGKEADPKVVDCGKPPANFVAIDFNADWIPTAVLVACERYRYDYRTGEWRCAENLH